MLLPKVFVISIRKNNKAFVRTKTLSIGSPLNILSGSHCVSLDNVLPISVGGLRGGEHGAAW